LAEEGFRDLQAHIVTLRAILLVERRLIGLRLFVERARLASGDGRWYGDAKVGRYRIVDLAHKPVVLARVDLEEWGRQHGVLTDGGELAAE
jgi:hypothetical protein